MFSRSKPHSIVTSPSSTWLPSYCRRILQGLGDSSCAQKNNVPMRFGFQGGLRVKVTWIVENTLGDPRLFFHQQSPWSNHQRDQLVSFDIIACSCIYTEEMSLALSNQNACTKQSECSNQNVFFFSTPTDMQPPNLLPPCLTLGSEHPSPGRNFRSPEVSQLLVNHCWGYDQGLFRPNDDSSPFLSHGGRRSTPRRQNVEALPSHGYPQGLIPVYICCRTGDHHQWVVVEFPWVTSFWDLQPEQEGKVRLKVYELCASTNQAAGYISFQGVHQAWLWWHALVHKSSVSFDGNWWLPWAGIPVVCGQLVHITKSLSHVAGTSSSVWGGSVRRTKTAVRWGCCSCSGRTATPSPWCPFYSNGWG